MQADVIERYDHVYFNDLIENPTAELIAADICKTLEAAVLGIARVRLWETDDCMVEVRAVS